MKFASTAVATLLVGSISAFTTVQKSSRNFRLTVVSDFKDQVANGATVPAIEIEVDDEPVAPVKIENASPAPVASAVEELPHWLETTEPKNMQSQIEPGRFDTLKYSIALPFLERPNYLDGSQPGDFGFDPCGFGDDGNLYVMQESELRHGRLAMLAVVGWPMSELIAPGFMLQNGCAPSVLNGFNPVTGIVALSFFAAVGYFEYSTALRFKGQTEFGKMHAKDMAPVWTSGVAGDYNFDPLDFYNFCGNDAWGRKGIRQVEVVQGRLAMLGITYMALFEAVSGKPIVENNPLFHPNPLVPMAALGYFAWSQFYQLSDARQYPIKMEYTKDGEEMLRGLKRAVMGSSE